MWSSGGILDDPYTGRTIEFHKGEESSDQVQIDHVVALANAWRSGAWQWDATRRQEFANDPANLLAVDGNAIKIKAQAERISGFRRIVAIAVRMCSGKLL